MLRHCSFNQNAVPCHPRCCAVSSQNLLQSKHQASLLTTTSTPPLSLCNSAAPPPLSLCASTPVALRLPLSLCTATPVDLQPRGGPTPCFWDATWPHVFVVHPVNICNQSCTCSHTIPRDRASEVILNCSRLQMAMAEMAMAFIDATMLWFRLVVKTSAAADWLGCLVHKSTVVILMLVVQINDTKNGDPL